MRPIVEIQIGYRYTLWVVFHIDMLKRGTLPQDVCSLGTFLRAWRRNVDNLAQAAVCDIHSGMFVFAIRPLSRACGVFPVSISVYSEVGWLRARKATTFTKCGLCEYLIYCIQTTQDASRLGLMRRLSLHHNFQAAQRRAFNDLVEQSCRDPCSMVVFSIDKMDQQKSILPHSNTLRSTSLFKNGTRFVTGLVGVLLPALTKSAWVFTTFEDHMHGSSFQCSLALEVLLIIFRSLGRLPTRVVLGADNTFKESKNTIMLYFCVWALSNLKGSGLVYLELAFLMTGHTHGPVDAWFAYAMRALLGLSYANLEAMIGHLQQRMPHPPFWQHSRDIYEWKDSRPAWCKLTSQYVKGVGWPHAFRMYLDDAGSCLIQTKRWLTDEHWSTPQVLLDSEGVARLVGFDPPIVEPNWDRGAQGRHTNRDALLSWVAKLSDLMSVRGVDGWTPADVERLRKAGYFYFDMSAN